MFNKCFLLKLIKILIIILFCQCFIPLNTFATDILPSETIPEQEYSITETSKNLRVYDYAELLTEEESMFLTEQALQFDNYNLCVLFLTIKDADGKTTETYINSFYDAEIFGSNAILFVIDLDNEMVYIHPTGRCIEILSNNSIKYILDNTYYYAKQGRYYDFFKEAVSLSTSFVVKNASKSYVIPSIFSLTFSLAFTLFLSLFLIIKRKTIHNYNKSVPNRINGAFNVISKNTIFIGDKTNVLKDFYKN